MALTRRIERRIAEEYAEGDRQTVEELIRELGESSKEEGGGERIAAATLIHGLGQVDRLLTAVQVAREDWRDILMGSGLERADWRDRLASEFGA